MNEEIVKNLLEDFAYDNVQVKLAWVLTWIEATYVSLDRKSEFLVELRDLILKYNWVW